MVSPMSAERVNGIARYAREHEWNLMIQDRLGHTPLAWNGDGIIATLRSDPVSFKSISALMLRGIPLVDLTAEQPLLQAKQGTKRNERIKVTISLDNRCKMSLINKHSAVRAST